MCPEVLFKIIFTWSSIDDGQPEDREEVFYTMATDYKSAVGKVITHVKGYKKMLVEALEGTII